MRTRTSLIVGIILLGLALYGKVIIDSFQHKSNYQYIQFTENTPVLITTPLPFFTPQPPLVPVVLVLDDPPPTDQIPANSILKSIVVDYPQKIRLGQADTIILTIQSLNTTGSLTPSDSESRLTQVATPHIFNTPIGLEFEISYTTYFDAYIAATTFVTAPASPDRQLLVAEGNTWVWNIVSEKPGMQKIDMSLMGSWVPNNDIVFPIIFQAWNSNLSIEVVQPLFSIGQISLLSLISGLIGSGLSIPWILENLKKKKPHRKEKKK